MAGFVKYSKQYHMRAAQHTGCGQASRQYCNVNGTTVERKIWN